MDCLFLFRGFEELVSLIDFPSFPVDGPHLLAWKSKQIHDIIRSKRLANSFEVLMPVLSDSSYNAINRASFKGADLKQFSANVGVTL